MQQCVWAECRDNRLECYSLAWSPTLPSQYSRHIVHIEQIVQTVHIAHIVHIVQIVYCALCSLWQKPTNEGGKRLEPVELWHKFAYLKALHCSQYHHRNFTRCKKVCNYLKTWLKVCLLPIKLYLWNTPSRCRCRYFTFQNSVHSFGLFIVGQGDGWDQIACNGCTLQDTVLNFWELLSDI